MRLSKTLLLAISKLSKETLLATTLCTPVTAVITRRTKNNDAVALRFGSRVEVAFRADNGEEYYLGTVMCGADGNFTIVV